MGKTVSQPEFRFLKNPGKQGNLYKRIEIWRFLLPEARQIGGGAPAPESGKGHWLQRRAAISQCKHMSDPYHKRPAPRSTRGGAGSGTARVHTVFESS